jgi:hypothetical protein
MTSLLRAAAALLVVLASTCLALAGLRGPSPVAATAPAEQFSAERAFEHVRHIAEREHTAGSTELARVRGWIAADVRASGLEVEEQGWSSEVAAWRDATPVERKLVNLFVRVAPREQPPTASILLVAHYDSRTGCPGASDDGLGVSVLLEALRAFRAEPPRRLAILALLTDGEELGCLGAKQFMAAQFAKERIDAVINLDALGDRAPLLLIEVGADGDGLVRSLLRCSAHSVGSSLASEVFRFLPNRTDFSAFSRAGVRGLGFATVGGAGVYHRSTDTPDRLDPRILQQCGETVMALARAIDDDGIPRGVAKSTFFTLFGSWVVRYPPLVDIAIAIVAVLLLGLGSRDTTDSVATLGGGFVSVLLILACAGAGAGATWSLAQLVRWNDPLAVSDERGLIAIALCALGFAAFLARARFARRFDERATSIANCALWSAGGCAACVLAPGAAFAFVIPACLIAASLCMRNARHRLLALAFALFAILAVLAPIAVALHAAGRAAPGFGAAVTSVMAAWLVTLAWPLLCAMDERTLRAFGWIALVLGAGGLVA